MSSSGSAEISSLSRGSRASAPRKLGKCHQAGSMVRGETGVASGSPLREFAEGLKLKDDQEVVFRPPQPNPGEGRCTGVRLDGAVGVISSGSVSDLGRFVGASNGAGGGAKGQGSVGLLPEPVASTSLQFSGAMGLDTNEVSDGGRGFRVWRNERRQCLSCFRPDVVVLHIM